MATINDIAKYTGYSKTTVSRALNRKGRLSQKTRNEVIQAAEKLNYIANSKAVSLSTGKSYTLGIIVPYSVFNSYHDRLMNGILSEAFKNGYKVTFLPTNYSKQKELAYLKLMQSKEYDGIIITSAANDYKTIAEYLKFGPIVSCEDTADTAVPSVTVKRDSAFAAILDLLIDKEIRNIGVCFSRSISKSYNAKTVYDLFSKKIPGFSMVNVFEKCKIYDDGLKAAAYFSMLSPKIEAIFASSDEIAVAITDHYKNKGLSLPILIGQENQPIAEYMGFSSVDFKPDQIGRQAVSMCLENTAGKKRLKSKTVLRGTLAENYNR